MQAITTKFTIKQSPFSVAILDKNGHILSYSNRFSEELNCKEDLTGQDYFTLIPETPAGYKNVNKAFFEGKTSKTEIHRFIPKDGKPRWYKWKLSYWTTDSNRFGGLVIVHEDVTEFRRNEELLSKAMNVAKIGGWEVDLVNNTIYWSEITKEIHGVPQDFVPDLEKGINFYKEGEDRDKITELVSDAIANGTTWDTELRIITAQGNEKWVHAKGEAEVVNGKSVRLFGTFQDIDIRKKMEIKNRETTDRLAVAAKTGKIGIWEFDITRNRVVWSDETYHIFGIDKSETDNLQEAWASAVHPEDLVRAEAELEDAVVNGTEYNTEIRAIWPNGSTRHIRTVANIMRDNEGNALKIIGANWDITQIRDSEKQLKDLLSITTEQNDSLMNFAHIVSHNLRSHSSNLSMLTSFLEGEKDQIERERLIKMLLEASESLDETVGHLTEVVQLKTEAVDKIKDMNLLSHINAVIKNLALMLEEEGTTCDIDIPKTTRIKAIPAYLDSIFLNLFTNSLKYKSEERTLHLKIKARTSGDKVLVSFQDNGQGIDLERHGSKIFGMYKTFHKHKDAKGIGLFITRNQIEAMQGRIEVESAVGEGTTFHLTFKNANG